MTLPFLSYVQMDASARKTVQPTMLGVAASVLAVVCKRMQQLTPNNVAPTMLGVAASVLVVVCKRMQQLTPNNVGTCSASCYARAWPQQCW